MLIEYIVFNTPIISKTAMNMERNNWSGGIYDIYRNRHSQEKV